MFRLDDSSRCVDVVASSVCKFRRVASHRRYCRRILRERAMRLQRKLRIVRVAAATVVAAAAAATAAVIYENRR
jgi:hypothetical protein